MVLLDGVAEPVRLKPENLLCRMFTQEQLQEGLAEYEPEWCLASREVVVGWQQPAPCSSDRAASLQTRAAQALLAAGTGAAELRAAGVPDDLVAIVERTSRSGLLSVTVPADPELAEPDDARFSLSHLLFEDTALEHEAFEDADAWRLEQPRGNGARWVLPVAPYDENMHDGHTHGGPRVAELMPYFELLKRVSQRVARFNASLQRGEDSRAFSDPRSHRGFARRVCVVASPPLCILPADDDCRGYYAHGHLRFGFPLFYGGKDVPFCSPPPRRWRDDAMVHDCWDGIASQLHEVLKDMSFPLELCRGRWKVHPPRCAIAVEAAAKRQPPVPIPQVKSGACLFSMQRKSNAFSSDDDTVLGEAESISSVVDRVCAEMARRFTAAGRGDVQVRLEFDPGDEYMLSRLPPKDGGHGALLHDDEHGELYCYEEEEGEEEEDWEEDEEEEHEESDSSGREWEDEDAHQDPRKVPSESDDGSY